MKMYKEAHKYLQNIGFKKTALAAVTDKNTTLRTFYFVQGKEKIILEYKQDQVEEVLKIVFKPLDIKFVYDILLMRFNQIAKENKNKIYVFNN